jgi:hypothetical protein
MKSYTVVVGEDQYLNYFHMLCQAREFDSKQY